MSMIKCPVCKGTGNVNLEDLGMGHMGEGECTECNGTGYVLDTVKKVQVLSKEEVRRMLSVTPTFR